MNMDQLEAFVVFAASKGLGVSISVGAPGDGTSRWLFTGIPESNLNVCKFHRATKVEEAIQGGLEKLAGIQGVPPDPTWYLRALMIREQIEKVERSALLMDFWLTFEVMRLERLGLPALGALVTKVLQGELTPASFEQAKEDLDDVLKSTTMSDFINNLDGLLVWSREFDEVKVYGSLGDSLSQSLLDTLRAQV